MDYRSPLRMPALAGMLLLLAAPAVPGVELVTRAGGHLEGERLVYTADAWRLDERRLSDDEVAVVVLSLAPGRVDHLAERVVTRDGTIFAGRLLVERGLASVRIQRADGTITVPRESLARLVLAELAPDADVAEAPAGEHLILRDGRAVAGSVEWMTVATVSVATPAGDLRLPRGEVHRIELAQDPQDPPRDGHTLRASSGDVIHGRLSRLDDEAALMETPYGEISVDRDGLLGIWVRSPQIRPLTALPTPAVETTPYIELVHQPTFDIGLFGGELRVAGIPCDRGVATHSRTILRWELPEAGSHLVAIVGMDTTRTAAGVADFAVAAGGGEVWRERIAGDEAPRLIVVPLNAARALELRCDYGPFGSGGDHGVWAWPVVLR